MVNSDLVALFMNRASNYVGLLEDDNQYHMATEEALISNSAAGLRSLLPVILTWCAPSYPLEIYEHHKETIAEDLLNQHCTRLGNADLDHSDNIFNLALNN